MEPSIKELLKDAWEVANKWANAASSFGQPEVDAKFTPLKQAIKKLRKENKVLKKEKIKLCGAMLDATNENINTVIQVLEIEKKRILNESNKPVAEFKCAKTKKPSKSGEYFCIITDDLSGDYRFAKWYIGLNVPIEDCIIAFTETTPDEIIKHLKK